MVVAAWSEEQLPEDFHLTIQMCYQVDGKQYVFDVKFVTEEAYITGIKTVATARELDGQFYDLSGRKVLKPVRGLYIMGNKKLLVK